LAELLILLFLQEEITRELTKVTSGDIEVDETVSVNNTVDLDTDTEEIEVILALVGE